MDKYYAYIGSWEVPMKPNASGGITIAEYEPETGSLTPIKHVLNEINCSMLTYDEKRGILYTSDERQFTGACPGGRVIALKVDPITGDLAQISDLPSYGKEPSYVAYDPKGEFLVLTNHSTRIPILKTEPDGNGGWRMITEYDETAAVLYELDADGAIIRACDLIKHTRRNGSPKHPNPLLHSARFTPNGEYVFICDNGDDGYYVYRLDRENKKLILADMLASVPGAAPRYSVLHPDLPIIYFNNESARLLTAARYGKDGKLEKIADYPTVNGEVSTGKDPMQSDLKMSADGQYIYNILRADNLVSVFKVDKVTGVPSLIQTVAAAGSKRERYLAISPDGRYLFLCGCDDK